MTAAAANLADHRESLSNSLITLCAPIIMAHKKELFIKKASPLRVRPPWKPVIFDLRERVSQDSVLKTL